MSEKIQVTPNGTAIKFQTKPYRRYFARKGPVTPLELADEKGWGKKKSSVTEILGILDKPALPWWGMTIGVDGILHLLAIGIVTLTLDGEDVHVEYNKPMIAELEEAKKKKTKSYKGIWEDEEIDSDAKRLVKLLTLTEKTVNHVRDNAGARGTKAHDAFETWCRTGILPAAEGFPEDQQEYVEGLHKFFAETTMTHVSTEIMVASLEHDFAGRYDLRCILTNKRFKINGVKSISDLKTSKGVYVSHFLQIEGYEGASIECGWKPSDKRFVVHCRGGDYEIVESEAEYGDFLAAIRLQRAIKRLGGL
jgi:hypothetical protein